MVKSIHRSGLLALQFSSLCLADNLGLQQILGALSPLKGWLSSDWNYDTPTNTGSTPSNTQSSDFWKPTAGQSWNIQLLKVPDVSAAEDNAYSVWDFDMALASSELINSFHAKGRRVICYFSAGSVEDYRSDAGDFPKEAVGKVMDGVSTTVKRFKATTLSDLNTSQDLCLDLDFSGSMLTSCVTFSGRTRNGSMSETKASETL